MSKTNIQWTWPVIGGVQYKGETQNFSIGCVRVPDSPGCENCYAFALHDRRHVAWKRGGWPTAPVQYHRPFSATWKDPETDKPQGVQIIKERLIEPFRWREPRCVFVNSMSDFWHDAIPDDIIKEAFGMMALTPRHIFQILTKRPERMQRFMRDLDLTECVTLFMRDEELQASVSPLVRNWNTRQVPVQRPAPLSNVWLGVSVENQKTADARIPLLLETPAVIRFLSCEPLLGDLDLSEYLHPELEIRALAHYERTGHYIGGTDDPDDPYDCQDCAQPWVQTSEPRPRLHWVIIGGESGPHARPLDLTAVKSLIHQAHEGAAEAFVKQLGTEWAQQVGAHDRHGGDPTEWPADFNIREYPTIPVTLEVPVQEQAG